MTLTLEDACARLWDIALEEGLDPNPVAFEVVPAGIMYEFGAYGLPGRFGHWTRGKAFHLMKMHYDLGLHRLYEMVVNTMPAQAYLLDKNTDLENKFVIAHVLGHSDFFKHNVYFQGSVDTLPQTASAHAERVHRYEQSHGLDAVEEVLDAALAIEVHVAGSFAGQRRDARRDGDLLAFFKESPALEEWERDLVAMVHEESLYFEPQRRTKVINEGWAVFWHLRLLRRLALTDAEYVDFARLHSQVAIAHPLRINPYHLGYAIFQDIQRRYDAADDESLRRAGVGAGSGLDKAFEVRELCDDVAFVRNHLSDSLVRDLDLLVFAYEGGVLKVRDVDPQVVRGEILRQMLLSGRPLITVEDDDYEGRHALLLHHAFDGRPLDIRYAEETLKHLYRLWRYPVYLETECDGKRTLLSFDGKVNAKITH